MPKRYYWLKLKEDFFDEESIRLLEAMENGKDYVIFLLKLRLRAINTNGHLNFKGIMPYNEKMLATITNTNIDIVKSALTIFADIGLLTRLDDGTIYLEQVQELIGSQSESYERVKKHRERKQLETKALHSNDNETECNTDIDIEIEKQGSSEKFPDDSLEMKMTDYMIEKIKESYPNAKVPDTPTKKQKWCTTFNRLMRIDGRTKDEIGAVMKWVYQDDFWDTNIRSPEKLREKWDTVYLQMSKGGKKADKAIPLEHRNYL